MKLEFSQQFFEKYSNIKFHINPSSGSQVVPCGQKDGRTGMTKLIFAFRNFANPIKSQETVMGLIKLHDKEVQNLHSAADITLIWVVVRLG